MSEVNKWNELTKLNRTVEFQRVKHILTCLISYSESMEAQLSKLVEVAALEAKLNDDLRSRVMKLESFFQKPVLIAMDDPEPVSPDPDAGTPVDNPDDPAFAFLEEEDEEIDLPLDEEE